MVAKHQKGRWTFLLMAYGISWSIAGAGYLLGVTIENRIGYLVMAGSFMFGPAIAAIIQQRLIDRAPWQGLGLDPRAIQWKMVVNTVLIGVSIVPACLLIAYLLGDRAGVASMGHVSITQDRLLSNVHEQLEGMGGATGRLDALFASWHVPGALLLIGILLIAVLAAATFNLPATLGEELGWRGYLYQSTAHWSGVRRVLFTGVIWGAWHAPLIAMGHNYPGHPVLGIGLMIVFTSLLALLFDRSRSRSGSVWAPCVLHGIINGSAGAFALFAWGGEPLVASPVGVVGFIAILLICIVVLVFDRRYRLIFFHAPTEGAIR